jgi:hypothetical protein
MSTFVKHPLLLSVKPTVKYNMVIQNLALPAIVYDDILRPINKKNICNIKNAFKL